MKIEDLRKAIGDIDEDLIEEADQSPAPRKAPSRWIWIASIAAAFILVLSSVLILPRLLNKPNSDPYVSTDLELLSFQIVNEEESTLKSQNEERILLLAEHGEQGQQFEPIDHGVQRFRVSVKNMKRVPFIDLVVFLSWKNTAVVFNEGHGEYQCASTTVFEDGLWVTNIEFDLEPVFDEQFEASVEILQIAFLGSNNSLMNASIMDNNVSGKKLGKVYSSEFSLQNGGIRYQIIFENDEVFASAEEGSSEQATILSSVTYSDHEGTHICPVKAIGDSFLSSNKNILTFTIPSTVTILGDELLDDCNYLEYIIFEGTVNEWTERFDNWNINRPCLIVYCSDGITAIGEHVPEVSMVSFDPDTMVCTIQDRHCLVCGQLLEEGTAETLLPLTRKSLVLKKQLTDDSFLSIGNLLISQFRNNFEAPLDLSDIFAISITFQTNNLDKLLTAKAGQLEISSSGIQDVEEIYWSLSGQELKNCQKTDDNKYRITLCIRDAKNGDLNGESTCCLSKINFIRMFIEMPGETSKIHFKINDISLYTTEALYHDDHVPPIQKQPHQLTLSDCSDASKGWNFGSADTVDNSAPDYILIGPFNGTYKAKQISASFRLPESNNEETQPYINADGYRFLCFDLFVSDASQLKEKMFTLELSSGKEFGKRCISLTLPVESFFDFELKNGWNHAVIGMDCTDWKDSALSTIDFSQISGFRFYNTEGLSLSSDFLLGFDGIYFWDGFEDGYQYDFLSGYGLDNKYIISSTGQMHTEDFIFNDCNMVTILKFHIEDATNVEKIEMVMKTGGELALFVSKDGEAWETLFYCSERARTSGYIGLRIMSRYYDLTDYVDLDTSQDVFIKIGDSSADDGYGGRLYDVSLQLGLNGN